MSSPLSKLKETFLDILFPPLCVHCKRSLKPHEKHAFICDICTLSIPVFDTLFCGTCNARLPEGKKSCHLDSPYLLGAVSIYRNETIKRLIWNLKYEEHPAVAHALGFLLNQYLERISFNLSNVSIIPIPLHPHRLKQRGFNQSELIAKPIEETRGIPLLKNALVRKKRTSPQAECRDWKIREENMKGSFEINPNISLMEKSILLIDDVTTSGSTLREAAETLKNAGVQRITALVIAKAG